MPDFKFKSFMVAYKFYNQYALKTNNDAGILSESMNRALSQRLYFANEIATLLRYVFTNYPPALPTAGHQASSTLVGFQCGELVSSFPHPSNRWHELTGRSINPALQSSRIGGGVDFLSNLREAEHPSRVMKELIWGCACYETLLI